MSSSATSRVFHWRTRASVWRPTPRRRVCSSGPWAIRPGLDVESMHGVWLRSRAQALPTGLWTPRPRRGLRTGAGSTGRRPNCSVRRQTRPGRIGGPGQSNRRTFSSSRGSWARRQTPHGRGLEEDHVSARVFSPAVHPGAGSRHRWLRGGSLVESWHDNRSQAPAPQRRSSVWS